MSSAAGVGGPSKQVVKEKGSQVAAAKEQFRMFNVVNPEALTTQIKIFAGLEKREHLDAGGLDKLIRLRSQQLVILSDALLADSGNVSLQTAIQALKTEQLASLKSLAALTKLSSDQTIMMEQLTKELDPSSVHSMVAPVHSLANATSSSPSAMGFSLSAGDDIHHHDHHDHDHDHHAAAAAASGVVDDKEKAKPLPTLPVLMSSVSVNASISAPVHSPVHSPAKQSGLVFNYLPLGDDDDVVVDDGKYRDHDDHKHHAAAASSSSMAAVPTYKESVEQLRFNAFVKVPFLTQGALLAEIQSGNINLAKCALIFDNSGNKQAGPLIGHSFLELKNSEGAVKQLEMFEILVQNPQGKIKTYFVFKSQAHFGGLTPMIIGDFDHKKGAPGLASAAFSSLGDKSKREENFQLKKPLPNVFFEINLPKK